MKLKKKIPSGNAGLRAFPEAWRRHFERLLKLRQRVAGDADELAHELGDGVTLHPTEVASDCFDFDLAYSLLSLEQDALAEIDAALQRIRDGTYGVCEITGKLIPRQRLEAIPWARYTVEAQEELENSGNAQQVHPNTAESVRGARYNV